MSGIERVCCLTSKLPGASGHFAPSMKSTSFSHRMECVLQTTPVQKERKKANSGTGHFRSPEWEGGEGRSLVVPPPIGS